MMRLLQFCCCQHLKCFLILFQLKRTIIAISMKETNKYFTKNNFEKNATLNGGVMKTLFLIESLTQAIVILLFPLIFLDHGRLNFLPNSRGLKTASKITHTVRSCLQDLSGIYQDTKKYFKNSTCPLLNLSLWLLDQHQTLE